MLVLKVKVEKKGQEIWEFSDIIRNQAKQFATKNHHKISLYKLKPLFTGRH